MNQTTFGFGPHLTLDLWDCNVDRLIDLQHISSLLDDLPAKIGMTKIAPPQILSYPGKEDSFDKGGISAFVLIAESHITIHTFKEQKHAFIDIFSCKEFDIDMAIKMLIEAFGANQYTKNITNRGKEFPKEVYLAVQIVETERKGIDNEK